MAGRHYQPFGEHATRQASFSSRPSRPQTMKQPLLCLLLAASTLAAQAQPAVNAFGKCLGDNTTGRDRKDLARWLFVAMGAHPDMKAISTINPSAPEDSSKAAGRLFTKLVVEACPKEAKAAVDAVGSGAFQSAFTVLGQLAMQELMTDKDVAAGMALLEKHVDTSKIQSVLLGK